MSEQSKTISIDRETSILNDCESWSKDLQNWLGDIGGLQENVNQIIGKLVQHQLGLNKHQYSLGKLKTALRNSASQSKNFDDHAVKAHNKEHDPAKLAEDVKDAHERIKKYHHEIMALVQALKNAI